MRILESKSFSKDCKKHFKGPKGGELHAELILVLARILEQSPLPEKYRDHALSGNWKDYRDCHLKPDLLLIYKAVISKTGVEIRLARLGSHAEIFG